MKNSIHLIKNMQVTNESTRKRKLKNYKNNIK